jgi:hypothetical protein
MPWETVFETVEPYRRILTGHLDLFVSRTHVGFCCLVSFLLECRSEGSEHGNQVYDQTRRRS